MGFFDNMKRSYHTNQNQLDGLIKEYQEMGFQQSYITRAWSQCNQQLGLFHDELIRISSIEDAKKMTQVDLLSSQTKFRSHLTKKEDDDIKRAIQVSLQSERIDDYDDLNLRKDITKPVGLKNLGNTCYMNVMLQSVFNIKDFRKLILDITINPNNEESGCLMIVRLQELFSVMTAGRREYVSPLAFFEAMAKFKPSNDNQISQDTMLVKGVQNDYYELWVAFLDAIEQGLKQVLQVVPNSSLEDSVQIFDTLKPFSHPITQQLQKIFYGRAEESLAYQEGDTNIIRFNETLFAVINLDSKDGELYKAFRNCQSLQIDEFMCEDGAKTQANIDIKILEPPKVISFYVNRVTYDPKLQKVTKNNGVFQFQEKMNIDCFYKNPEQTTKYNKSIQDQLEKLVEDENDCLEAISAFDDDGEQNASELVDQVAKLLRRSEFVRECSLSDDEFVVFDKDCVLSPNVLKSSEMIKQLEMHQNIILKKQEQMVKKLAQIQKQKKALMDQKQDVYCLTSVIIHDGSAESGHYNCFIYDKISKRWLKCNDRETSYVDFDTVYKTATGKLGTMRNVSGLVYEEQNWMEQSEQQTILPQQLSDYVEKQNLSLLRQLDQQVFDKALGCIKLRMEQIFQQTQIKSFDKQDEFSQIVQTFKNFNSFVFTHSANMFQYISLIQALEVESTDLNKRLNLPSEFEHYQNTFIANNFSKFQIKGDLKELQKSHLEMKALYQVFASIINQFNELFGKQITLVNYGSQLEAYTQTSNQLYTVSLQHKGQVNLQRLMIKVGHLVGALILKGCFYADYLTFISDRQVFDLIDCITRNTSKILYLPKIFKMQVFMNLDQTVKSIRGSFSQQSCQENILKQLNIQILNLIKTQNPLNTTDIEQTSVIPTKQYDNVDVEFLQRQYKQLASQQLKEWLDSFAQIERTQAIISLKDRQRLEEGLYFEIAQ